MSALDTALRALNRMFSPAGELERAVDQYEDAAAEYANLVDDYIREVTTLVEIVRDEVLALFGTDDEDDEMRDLAYDLTKALDDVIEVGPLVKKEEKIADAFFTTVKDRLIALRREES